MIAYQCVVLAILKVTSMFSLIFAWGFSNQTVLPQMSLYSDMTVAYFSIVMLYPLTANQVLSRVHKSYFRRIFNTLRTAALVGAALLFSIVTVACISHTSEMNRAFFKKISYVDSGAKDYRNIVNRMFYIFPIGSMICYGFLFLHMRLRKPEHAALRRFEGKRSRKVFAELLITIIIYGTMCVLFEVLNHVGQFSGTFGSAPLGVVLPVLNVLTETCLPMLLLFPNKEFKKTFSQILHSRSTTQNLTSAIR